MLKEDLLEMLKKLNLPVGEYYVLGGGALVVCGLKEKTADLDLCVSEELFHVLKEKYNLTEEDKNECGFYKVNDVFEIVPSKKENFTMQIVDSVYVEDLNRILNFKKQRNLPKDKKDIENIEKYLNK